MIIQWNRQIAGDKRHFSWAAFGQPALHMFISVSAGGPAPGPAPFWNANTGVSGLAGGDIDL